MSSVHAFFDFDDTLLDGDSILYWMRYYYRKRPRRRFFLLANWAGLLLFLARVINSHTLKRIFLWPMAYENPAFLEKLGEEFVREELAYRFNEPVLRRLWTHHLLGHKIWIISASASFYLKHLKTLLPMAEIEGTEVTWAERGLFRFPRYRYGNLRGANKIARLHALGFPSEAPFSFAYSDHHHDEFLLRFAEFAICVRPTPKLRRLARKNGWPVIDWKRERPAWKVKLDKLGLLVFASGGEKNRQPRPLQPAREEEAAAQYAGEEARLLRACVERKYSEQGNTDVYKRLFAEAGKTADPSRAAGR
jgi:HAD superfamily phosphoserine phosphatase-like hydrolase